jgi:hypothetical protein
MKYVVDIDALLECLDCVDSFKYDGNYFIRVPVLKEFINRFPKDKVTSEYVEYSTQPQQAEST